MMQSRVENESDVVRLLMGRAIEDARDLGLHYFIVKRFEEKGIKNIIPSIIQETFSAIKTETPLQRLVEIGLSAGRNTVQ